MEALLNSKHKKESDEIHAFLSKLSEKEQREFGNFIRGARFVRELQEQMTNMPKKPA